MTVYTKKLRRFLDKFFVPKTQGLKELDLCKFDFSDNSNKKSQLSLSPAI